jgi:hypothetical protein
MKLLRADKAKEIAMESKNPKPKTLGGLWRAFIRYISDLQYCYLMDKFQREIVWAASHQQTKACIRVGDFVGGCVLSVNNCQFDLDYLGGRSPIQRVMRKVREAGYSWDTKGRGFSCLYIIKW